MTIFGRSDILFRKLTIGERLKNERLERIEKELKVMAQQDEQDSYLVDNDFRLSLIEMGVSLSDL